MLVVKAFSPPSPVWAGSVEPRAQGGRRDARLFALRRLSARAGGTRAGGTRAGDARGGSTECDEDGSALGEVLLEGLELGLRELLARPGEHQHRSLPQPLDREHVLVRRQLVIAVELAAEDFEAVARGEDLALRAVEADRLLPPRSPRPMRLHRTRRRPRRPPNVRSGPRLGRERGAPPQQQPATWQVRAGAARRRQPCPGRQIIHAL